jgi:hypothetical protein
VPRPPTGTDTADGGGARGPEHAEQSDEPDAPRTRDPETAPV